MNKTIDLRYTYGQESQTSVLNSTDEQFTVALVSSVLEEIQKATIKSIRDWELSNIDLSKPLGAAEYVDFSRNMKIALRTTETKFAFLNAIIDAAYTKEKLDDAFAKDGGLGWFRAVWVELSTQVIKVAFVAGVSALTAAFASLIPLPGLATTAGAIVGAVAGSLLVESVFNEWEPEFRDILSEFFMTTIYPQLGSEDRIFPDWVAEFVNGVTIGGTDIAEYSDILIGDNEANTFYGYGGDDTFRGLGGVDTYFGGLGEDTIELRDGVDWKVVHFGGEHISLPGETYFDGQIQGLEDYSGIEIIKFGNGANRLEVDRGTLIAVGGGGIDTLVLDGQAEFYSGRRDGSNIIITRGNDLHVTVTGFDLIDFLGDSSPAVDISRL